MTDRKQGTVKVLEKAIIVLEYLSRIEDEIDLSSIAQVLLLPKTTVLRLLTTLKCHNFVQQNEQSRRFRLGWALINLGKVAARAFNLVTVAHPFLERLTKKTTETVNLVLLDGEHALYVDQVVSPNIIRGVPSVGTPLGLYCTAAGKVLLSFQSPEQIEQTVKALKLSRLTPHTITDRGKFRRELQRIREQGFAVDNEETELGGCCVAAPIFGPEGKVMAAVSIMGPTHRVNPGSLLKLAETVRATAAELSEALGHRPVGR